MDTVIHILESGNFWTAVGSLAAVAGTLWAIRAHRLSQRTNVGNDTSAGALPSAPVMGIGSAVEELDSERAWVQAQVQAIQSAKLFTSLCLHTIHASSKSWKAQLVNAALAEAKARGVEIRVLAASNPECFGGAFELERGLGIEVRFSPEIRHYDLRFLIADSELAVVGVANPDIERGNYTASYSWALLRSSSMCEALERDFQRIWLSRHSAPFTRHCVDTIRRLGTLPSAKLASDLGMDYDIVRQFAAGESMASLMGNAVLVLYGNTCAGKSVLMRRLSVDYGATCLDFRDLLRPYVLRYGAEHINGEIVAQANEDLVRFCRAGVFDAIETHPESANCVLKQLFDFIRARAQRPIFVHCMISSDVALKRNEQRTVPIIVEDILRAAAYEAGGPYRDVCQANGVPIVTISAETSPSDCFQHLVAEVRQKASSLERQ